MPLYVKRPEPPIHAERYAWDEVLPRGVYFAGPVRMTPLGPRTDAYVNGRRGRQLVQEGDYVLTNPDDPGDRAPMRANEFERLYEPLVQVTIEPERLFEKFAPIQQEERGCCRAARLNERLRAQSIPMGSGEEDAA